MRTEKMSVPCLTFNPVHSQEMGTELPATSLPEQRFSAAVSAKHLTAASPTAGLGELSQPWRSACLCPGAWKLFRIQSGGHMEEAVD